MSSGRELLSKMGLLSWLNDLFGSYEEYGTPSVTLTGQPVKSKAERVIADYFTRHTLPQELTPTLAVVEALAKGAAIGILSKWAGPQQFTIAAERMERARGIIERRPLSFVLRCECYLQGFFSWSCVGIVRTGQAVLEGIRGACSLHVEFMLRLMVTRLRNISRVAESLILSALLIILS